MKPQNLHAICISTALHPPKHKGYTVTDEDCPMVWKKGWHPQPPYPNTKASQYTYKNIHEQNGHIPIPVTDGFFPTQSITAAEITVNDTAKEKVWGGRTFLLKCALPAPHWSALFTATQVLDSCAVSLQQSVFYHLLCAWTLQRPLISHYSCLPLTFGFVT